MKTKVLILAFIGSVLYTSFNEIHAFENEKKLAGLRSLIERGVIYDEQISIDSVIKWSEEVIATWQSTADEELYFMMQLRQVEAYLINGDISLAIDRARRMYKDSKNRQYPFGSILAKQALGSTYEMSNMTEEALEFYNNSLKELKNLPDHESYRVSLLLKVSNALLRAGRFDEMKKVIKEMNSLIEQRPATTHLAFYVMAQEVMADILQADTHQDQLNTAKATLDKMESINQIRKEKFLLFTLNYTTAAYYCALGKWEKSAYQKSLQIYQGMLSEISNRKNSTFYRWISAEIIRLHKAQGSDLEVCKIYQELYPIVDSIASQNYSRQISTLKTKYRISQMTKESNEKQHSLLLSILIGGSLLILLFALIIFRLRKQQQALAHSTQHLRQTKINAENAIRAKSVFLSNMSHEIRTPLNALSGFSSLLTEEGLDADTRRQCNEVIQQNSELLLKLIDDVIDLSSLEFGKMQFSIAKHDAISVCRNVIDTVGKVKQTQANLLFETDIESIEIDTDDSRLQQVLINLLINATKFTPEGTITLKVEKIINENTLLFSVTDTGCGIPLEKQSNIFQRFEKLNENVQGSGLGLSICQLIIEHIGGNIWIDSEYTAGSRFMFTHPISTKSNAQKKEVEL